MELHVDFILVYMQLYSCKEKVNHCIIFLALLFFCIIIALMLQSDNIVFFFSQCVAPLQEAHHPGAGRAPLPAHGVSPLEGGVRGPGV